MLTVGVTEVRCGAEDQALAKRKPKEVHVKEWDIIKEPSLSGKNMRFLGCERLSLHKTLSQFVLTDGYVRFS